MLKQFHANKARMRRHQRIRHRLEGSPSRPRLNVFRSGQHIYAQIIDDSVGRTLVSASSLDESLRSFAPSSQQQEEHHSLLERVGDALHTAAEKAVEVAQEVAPTSGKGAKAAKAPKGGQAQKGAAPAKGGKPTQSAKTVLPAAQKGAKKTPVEALAAISNNRKVALAREVGKLVAQRAKEQGVSRVVFDRGGYTYHGRVAALAEGAREAGLDF
jgi:ribosomal protein L18